MGARSAAAILCPCCEKLLYETVAEGTGAMVIHRGVQANPSFEKDDRGHFMQCPHCCQRIGFRQILIEDNTATSYELLPVQDG